MQTVLEAVRDVLGTPTFYHSMTGTSNPTWDYGLMIEYLVAGMLLLVVVSSIFKLLLRMFK